MNNMFDNYFEKPFLAGSRLKERRIISNDLKQMLENIDYLLDFKCDKWFLENFVWFYEKRILQELFAEHGCLEQMVNRLNAKNENIKIDGTIRTGIFEIILYQNHIYNNKEKYGYKVIDVDCELEKHLRVEDRALFDKEFYAYWRGNCGLLEHAPLFLTDSNVKDLASIFKKNNFNIIRCDSSSYKNFRLQAVFMNIVQPDILAASQAHAFGMNNRLCIFKTYRKVKKLLSCIRLLN